MIKLVKIESETPDRKICILFSDTKTEVPQTGEATSAVMAPAPAPRLDMGSMIYTAEGDLGFLKSNDRWNWME